VLIIARSEMSISAEDRPNCVIEVSHL